MKKTTGDQHAMEKRCFLKFRKYLTLLVVLLCPAVCASAETPSDSPKDVSASHSDGFSVAQNAVTLRFQCAPSSISQVIDAPDGSLLVLYNTEETDAWQCRLSLFSPCGNETWQYVVSEYALDSGYGSAVDFFVSDSEITLDAYETREQTAYCEVILTWDGTVRRKKTVRVADDMRQRIHDFSLYTVREFYTNARAKILCKQTGKSTTIDIPNGFPVFAQIGDFLIGATVGDDLVAFQAMDQQGNLRFIEGNAGDGLELKGFAGIRAQKVYSLFTREDDGLQWLLCSIDLDENTLEWTEIPLNHDLVWYSAAAAIIQDGIVFAQHDGERHQLYFTLLKWDRTHANFLSRIPNGYHQFLDPRDEKSIRAILWDGVSDCASLVTYTPTCGAR